MRFLRAILVTALAAAASAANLVVAIPPSPPILPNPATLPSSTHAILLGGPGVRHNALIRRDNTLHFHSLDAGSYLLSVYSRDIFFPPIRVDITTSADGSQEKIEAWQTIRGNQWDNKGSSYGSVDGHELRFEIRPSAQKDFYQVRGGFSLVSFLKSPMILMGLFSVVMIFGMPYLMENMDAETKKEFEEMQKNSPLTGSGGAASQLQNFDIAGFLAGKGSSADTSRNEATSGSSIKKR